MNPRTCVGCRKQDSREQLHRVVSKELFAQLDSSKSAPGRGCWVHARCLDQALERIAFGRALSKGVDCSQLKNQFSNLEQAEKSAG